MRSEPTADGGAPGLHEAEWDLEPLLLGAVGADGPERTALLLAGAAGRAETIVAAHRGRIINRDADGLSNMVAELAAIRELAMRARSFARLRWPAGTADQARGALMQRV